MEKRQTDTIFALSTAQGKSGVAVIRISGPSSMEALRLLGVKDDITPRVAHCRLLHDSKGRLIDQAVVLYFPKPGSFTGEDVVELQVHGSRAVIRLLYEELQTFIRIAEPGEFSLRAYLNGKMDLTRAEGIADLINAETDAQLRQALAQSTGKLEKQYDQWRSILLDILTDLEACIDFPEDVDSSRVLGGIYSNIEKLCSVLGQYLNDCHRGERLRSGVRVVILGPPNAGKSTLFNSIARRNAAIVSEHPGTTRDVLEVAIDIGGYPYIVLDTAGIRESCDGIEQEGIKRAKMAAEEADIRIVMYPYETTSIHGIDPICDLQDEKTILVLSKADNVDLPESKCINGKEFHLISVHQDRGIGKLLTLIQEKSRDSFPKEGDVFITSQRHRSHLQKALQAVDAVSKVMPIEIVAEHLRIAAYELGRVTGAVSGDDILDDIFSKFCIGK
ncbi:tRNA uridine-5-carboxymethylaminomethyl(34) synthesis GTPase MnmE [Anaplasma phagocytophilum]|uniref:tRNA uridine-5-carboxymethylaminomethyl(34) synthesis GTPase MnmE n=1 Tax=Anaplasma phagocytophilum TaxID=948 RepID=UPI00200C6C5D|nr:tRNA uridine-5-carboxymethylaminomethyl(34) synthesis GTPase MnmE [Anaplasma phagocytophilum]UQD54329.1 tRNA uridine-5-carboxymethylaminomethyl(34) synthesis GTPase MnmE [Anaplasma phagocytophilum]